MFNYSVLSQEELKLKGPQVDENCLIFSTPAQKNNTNNVWVSRRRRDSVGRHSWLSHRILGVLRRFRLWYQLFLLSFPFQKKTSRTIISISKVLVWKKEETATRVLIMPWKYPKILPKPKSDYMFLVLTLSLIVVSSLFLASRGAHNRWLIPCMACFLHMSSRFSSGRFPGNSQLVN